MLTEKRLFRTSHILVSCLYLAILIDSEVLENWAPNHIHVYISNIYIVCGTYMAFKCLLNLVEEKSIPTWSHKAAATWSMTAPSSRYSPEYRMYAQVHRVIRVSPIIILHRLAMMSKPMNPVTPAITYVIKMTTNSVAGVRAAWKIFLLSLCLIYWM